jgi:hypothetical protein
MGNQMKKNGKPTQKSDLTPREEFARELHLTKKNEEKKSKTDLNSLRIVCTGIIPSATRSCSTAAITARRRWN